MRKFGKACRAVAVVVCCARIGTVDAQAVDGARPAIGPQALADRIQAEVAEIRGLPFKAPVRAENQSVEAFGGYIDGAIAQNIPPQVALHYDSIARKLGLYSAPEPLHLEALMKSVMTSQAAAYYDPEEKAFFVLMQDLPEAAMGMFYSHELYHGFQDQYFDLATYMFDGQRDRSLNDDQLLARQAVVEGEATYVMTLWALANTLGSVPARPVLAEVVRLQSGMDMAAMRAALEEPQVAALLGEEHGGDLAAAIDAAAEIPMFVIETMVGAYLKGLSFVFEVHAGGWTEVEKLYEEYPPASTEQILHPDKWFARESPTTIDWPAFDNNTLFAGWDLLEQNVLGEIQWRIVFAEHGLGAEAPAVAGGWDGDRYAVFKHRDSGRLLLLMHTSWDSEADAEEFAEGYGRLLTVKYEGADEPTRVSQDGRDVLIVEGGDKSTVDSFFDFVKTARRRR